MRWGLILLVVLGCEARDDASPAEDRVAELRAALPSAESMSILMPGTAAADDHAFFYTFTRLTTVNINELVRGVGRTVEDIVDRAPAETDGQDFAVWGPWTDALAPVTYRVRVERDGEGFVFRVDGWPKGQTGGAVVVLSGETRPAQGAGTWTYDLTAANTLDPVAQPSRGRLDVDFVVGASRALEVAFTDVEWPQQPTPTNTLYRYTAEPDGSGTFDYISNLDIHADDNPELDRRELLQVRSRWLAEGPGRADIFASKGDLEAEVEVEVVQCWTADFTQSYVAYALPQGMVAEGDAGACPFTDAQRPAFADFDPDDFEDEDFVAALPTLSDFSLGLNPAGAVVEEPAGYYQMTVALLGGMQHQVSSVLRTLRNITRQPATRCTADGCTWGPWTDWSTRVSWQLDIRRAGAGFNYDLAVQRFGAANPRPVVTGGFVPGEGVDGHGWFDFDNAALAEVDPEAGHGTAAVRAEYARLGVGATLAMRIEDGDEEQARYYVSVVNGGGTLDARLAFDLDRGRPGRLAVEQIEARVRWLADGAGTANVIASAGNLGNPIAAVECWDRRAEQTHFALVARNMDPQAEPAVDPVCTHPDFQEPELRPLGDEQ